MQVKLILMVVAIGFVLASVGQLQKFTHLMTAIAVDTQRNDLVSLGKWNRKLNSTKQHRQSSNQSNFCAVTHATDK